MYRLAGQVHEGDQDLDRLSDPVARAGRLDPGSYVPSLFLVSEISCRPVLCLADQKELSGLRSRPIEPRAH